MQAQAAARGCNVGVREARNASTKTEVTKESRQHYERLHQSAEPLQRQEPITLCFVFLVLFSFLSKDLFFGTPDGQTDGREIFFGRQSEPALLIK